MVLKYSFVGLSLSNTNNQSALSGIVPMPLYELNQTTQ